MEVMVHERALWSPGDTQLCAQTRLVLHKQELSGCGAEAKPSIQRCSFRVIPCREAVERGSRNCVSSLCCVS